MTILMTILCFKLLIEWQTTYGQTWIFLPFGVILELKLRKERWSKSDPSKHGGLSIGSTVCKLIINIILERVRPWYEVELSKAI